eukprot:TRINITY_DN7_c9_g1_i1.p1 TRINITY_DN7_c9_g1~~TRINITY_DN7_c9_g1_i1.p1  ORF type:complete len:377 (+),score=126.29 TRINITY_DN7_c9_g1_i1:58-1188(+)
MDYEEEDVPGIESPQVVDMYKAASEIVNAAMLNLLQALKPGLNVVDVCVEGDRLIELGASNTYKKVKMGNKGIGFPTCVSINNCIGHFSPLPEDPNVVLKVGDVVKIDMGCHINGYVSQCAHTLILGAEGAVTGKIGDVICAAHYASECAIRLLRPGKTNTDVSNAIAKVANLFQVSPVEGVISHMQKQHLVDGNNVILNKADVENQAEEFVFETNQVYGIDIVMSTGEGRSRELTNRTTVYKRAVDRNYQLKLQASRAVFSEINKKFPSLPFTLRSLDEKKRRLGIVELVKHDLLDSYPVLWEKEGETVAQFKFTVLILPNSTMRLNSFPLPHVSSAFSPESDPDLKQILAMSTKRSKKKKKAKKPKQDDQMDLS